MFLEMLEDLIEHRRVLDDGVGSRLDLGAEISRGRVEVCSSEAMSRFQ